jgi:Cu+-exporting ATPase
MAEATAAPRPAPDSGSRCPGCAKGVDPLRAGHVAIYDGVFLYYCDATCKALHLRTIASHLGDDVPTMDPPAVAERVQVALAASEGKKTNGASHANGADHADGGNGADGSHALSVAPVEAVASSVAPPISHERASQERAPELDEERDEPESARDEPIDEEPPATIEAPSTVRSPEATRQERHETVAAPTPSAAPHAETTAAPRGMQTRTAVSIAGGIAGVLVPLLAIADVALGVRLALGVFATIALVVRAAMAKSDIAGVHPLIAAVPVVGAIAVAVACDASNDPRAASIAVLAGLSASIAIGVEEAIERAWREVDAARAKVSRALDVTSRVVRGAGVVDARDVKAGEEVMIEAGDVVGVDGVVCAGEAVVVPWDGAPIEVTKGEGDAIVAGALVVSGRARIVTAWAGVDRAWARATSSRAARPDVSAPTVRLARGIALRGIPAAAIVAGGAAYASGVASGWIGAIAAACAVAVALGGRGVVSAVALIHARAQTKTLMHGIVYRDARAFDAAGRAAIAVVCSRGTVLTGVPEIVAVEAVTPSGETSRDTSDSHILALAAGAETASTHPFANAILRAARTRGVRLESVRSATVHAGLGVTALASNGDRLIVGSRALLLQEKVSVAVVEARASELEAQGRSVLLVALAGKLVGLVALQDGLRAGARAAVQRLLDARIEPVLLSGESRETCETIARALDIDHVRPEVLPADRGAEVRALAEGGQLVAAMGHPAGDDGALGAADVAIAMGGAGRSVGEWGVSLASDDVRDAALALAVAHSARDRARAALAIGLAPGVIAMLAVVFAVAPLVCGPLAMAASLAIATTLARRD